MPWHVFINQTCNSQRLPAGILHLHDKQNELNMSNVRSYRSCKECPGMPQSDHVISCSFSSTVQICPACPWHVFSQLSDGGVVTFKPSRFENWEHTWGHPQLWPSCYGESLTESIGKSYGKYGKVMRSTGFVDLGVSMGILLTKPGHGISCDYGAHLTSVHALKKPRKRGRNPEGKVWAASLVSHVTVAHHPSIRKISAQNAQHMQSAKSHHGDGLSSKASPTRKQWSMQTCQINPNHASRLKKIAPEPKNTSNQHLFRPYSSGSNQSGTSLSNFMQKSQRITIWHYRGRADQVPHCGRWWYEGCYQEPEQVRHTTATLGLNICWESFVCKNVCQQLLPLFRSKRAAYQLPNWSHLMPWHIKTPAAFLVEDSVSCARVPPGPKYQAVRISVRSMFSEGQTSARFKLKFTGLIEGKTMEHQYTWNSE